LILSENGDNGYSSTLSSASGLGIGGLAGAPLHPLALGNVKTLRGLLDSHEELKGVQVIGVGGVADSEGFARMRAVGASVVGVGTALGKEGMGVFGKILGRSEGARL
jgi:dihydroorotate dehydrogenase (fumarate)